MICESCGYWFLLESSTKCPDCGGLREAMVADGYDFLTANAVPIMDSTVGLKAANAHLARRVAELEADKSRRDILAQNIPPVGSHQPLDDAEASYAEQMEGLKGLPSLGDEAWFEIAMAYRAEIDDLTRQLAAQALAHAEQMEGLRAKSARAEALEVENANVRRITTMRVAELEDANAKLTLALASQNIEAWQNAMRVTPATPPTDAQQTAADVKAAPERRPDGTLKPAAKAWEAPKTGNDPRRIGS